MKRHSFEFSKCHQILSTESKILPLDTCSPQWIDVISIDPRRQLVEWPARILGTKQRNKGPATTVSPKPIATAFVGREYGNRQYKWGFFLPMTVVENYFAMQSGVGGRRRRKARTTRNPGMILRTICQLCSHLSPEIHRSDELGLILDRLARHRRHLRIGCLRQHVPNGACPTWHQPLSP